MRVAVAVVASASLAAGTAMWAAGPIELSLKRAVELATSAEGNANVQLSTEQVKQAEARSVAARSALLPDVSGSLGETNRTVNLEALGIRINTPIPGFQFPKLVGPFTTMDARLSGTQTVLDLSTIRKYQASKTGVAAAKSDVENVEEQVAGQVARAYLAALRAERDVETAESNVALARAVVKQAEDLKNAGTGTGIEVTRGKVQLANDEQRLVQAENGRRSAHLRLLRAMGMRLDTELKLTDRLQYTPVDAVTIEEAKALALRTRPDLKAQQEREETSRLSSTAAKMERMPSVQAFADYGSIGTGFDSAIPTRQYGISVKVPLFDGGKRDAHRAEAASQYRAARVQTGDLKDQIELDVRLAIDALRSSETQVKVANEGLDLAENELAQARRRFDAGVANSLEVTDAQTRLERARDNQTVALYEFNVARVDLAQATGRVRSMF